MGELKKEFGCGPIEKGIPLPPSKRGDGSLREALSSLGIGDSFVTTYTRDAAAKLAKRMAIKVETRKIGGGKARVWRVS